MPWRCAWMDGSHTCMHLSPLAWKETRHARAHAPKQCVWHVCRMDGQPQVFRGRPTGRGHLAPHAASIHPHPSIRMRSG